MKSYLKTITLVPEHKEMEFVIGQHMTCYNTIYPFKIFPPKGLKRLELEPITILYGGNGSGKTTLLNIVAEKLRLTRHSAFNGSAFFQNYVDLCGEDSTVIPRGSQILTSDDVSDYLLNMRHLNDGIDVRREELFAEYVTNRDSRRELRFTSLDDYDEAWQDAYDAKTRRMTKSRFVRERLSRNTEMLSNGETAMQYYLERITGNALYLIDEPENSLSAKYQMELAEFLFSAARFEGCQFVISTHSPFLLAIPGAKVYDLDSIPVRERKWTELENVRIYFDFFRKHKDSFDG